MIDSASPPVRAMSVAPYQLKHVERLVRAALLRVEDGEAGTRRRARSSRRLSIAGGGLRAAVQHDDERSARRQVRRDVLVHVERAGVAPKSATAASAGRSTPSMAGRLAARHVPAMCREPTRPAAQLHARIAAPWLPPDGGGQHHQPPDA